jgi:hypothetical protein
MLGERFFIAGAKSPSPKSLPRPCAREGHFGSTGALLNQLSLNSIKVIIE